MINTIDLTISGMPVIFYRLPNGDFKDLKFKYDGETYYESWKKYDKPIFTTINLINIESFKQLSYPIVDIKIASKKTTWWQRFWYDGWNADALYDIKIDVVDVKNVTYVKMRSGDKFIVDESVDFLKNALDGCVWTADFLKSLEK